MKITVELETDAEKAEAKRFLGCDESPQTFTATGRSGFRLLLALKQITAREDKLAKVKAKGAA